MSRQHSPFLRRTLSALATLFTLTALLASLWIVVPAPAYTVWLLSVVASEWSLWLGLIAATGVACAMAARRAGGGKWIWRVSLLCGALAILCAMMPLVSAIHAARTHDVNLSLRRYFSPSSGELNAGEIAVATHTFAVVDDARLQLNVYAARNERANGGGIIVVHGGSWNAGERSDFPQWNRWLAREGFTVFDVDYRLAPQPNWQSATGDVKCAVAWIKTHAAEFRVDPAKLALAGRSAGGHLALLAAYTDGDARLASSCTSDADVDTSVRAVVSFYAPTDLAWAYDNPANEFVINGPATLRRFLGGSPHETSDLAERFRLASPVTHIHARTPPTLLIHGGRDQLVREENMRRLGARLANANVAHDTVFLSYAQHGFDYNFNGWGAQVAQPVMLDFLKKHLEAR